MGQLVPLYSLAMMDPGDAAAEVGAVHVDSP
jgi:hypothetical protein